jgi:phosphoglycerate dehydrogenase-like enzyme
MRPTPDPADERATLFAMRLILDAEIRPESVARLRALSPELEVIDVTGDATFDATTLADPEAVVLIGSRPPTDLGGTPKLRWLQVRSAGVDHLAADPPWRKGLIVTNARGVYAVPIGEYVSGMVLRVHQPAAVWSADQAAHRWPTGDPRLIDPIRGKTAVIAGYGSIGREVARQLSGLGMRIVAVKPRPEVRHDASYRVPGTGDPEGSIPKRIVGVDGLVEAVREADILVLTMPLTDASRGIVGRELIAALPRRAWLINVSRGALVDEPALLEALREGRLAGAVLDVFGEEPLPPESPWWDAPNVIVTPHASGHTLRFFDELVIENVRRYLTGESLLNPVDPERGY